MAWFSRGFPGVLSGNDWRISAARVVFDARELRRYEVALCRFGKEVRSEA